MQPLPPQVLAGGAAALVAGSRDEPELPGRPRSVSNLPAPREAIPSPALGIEPPMPPGMALGSVPSDLPAPRAAVPYANLPAARESTTLGNLPAAREAVPHPNLPAAREAIAPPNLPASREAIPPSNLPASRTNIGLGNLPAPREAVPLPNLPASRADLPPSNLPAARTKIGLADVPAPRASVPLPNLPASRATVPLQGAQRPPTPVTLARLNLGDRSHAAEPKATKTPLAPLDLGNAFAQLSPSLDGLNMDLSPDEGAAPSSGLELDLLDDMSSPAPPSKPRSPNYGSAPISGMGVGDGELGFKLDIEGGTPTAPSEGRPNLAGSSALPAIEVNAMGVLEDAIPTLSPHRDNVSTETTSRNRGRGRIVVVAAGVTAAAAVAAAILFVLPILTKGSSAADVLTPFQPALDSDNYPAYKHASDALLQQAAQEGKADELRSAAAEWLLLAGLAHDAPKAFVSDAEQALSQILQNPEPSAQERRARALLEIAQGKPQRADSLMASIEDSTGGRLVLGLGQFLAGNATAAASAFDVAVSTQPQRVLPQFLLARALEASGQTTKAHEAYKKAVAANPAHLGAALGVTRTSGQKAPALLASLEKLAATKTDAASPAQRAAVHVLLGRTAAELGRTTAASKAFAQALAADPGHVEASLALSEALLREGHFNQAFARVQPVAGEAIKTADGLFALGGAMIATRRANEGLPLIETAIAKQPRDPRGPFFRAWAAEEAMNPDLNNAITLYEEALKLSPAFVPASLRLASLMQRTNRATEALKVLKSAENAGAPPTLLQMAWGQALIVAKQPQRAEEVFRKALAVDPALAPARLGLASSLEAQGRVGEAKLELDELLVQNPETEGLRERLAGLAVLLGEKDEAVAHYQAALASGKAGPEVHVALGRLALSMGNLDLAQAQLEKVAEESPATAGALFTLGQLRERQGALGKALGEYRRATSYENTPEVQLAYGRVLLQAGKEDDAMMAFREAFTLAEGHLEHGRVLLRRSKAEKAIVDFQAAVSIDPEMHDAYLLMGNAYDVMGETGKAADAWRNVVRIAPKNVEALYKLGRLEMDRAQVKTALDYLRKAAGDVPEDRTWAADVFFQLGYAELQAGSKKNARDALSKYLTLAPTDAPDRPVVEKQLDHLGVN